MKAVAKYDQVFVGLISGVLVPVIAFIIAWMVISDDSLAIYFRQFQQLNRLSSLISLSALPNLLIFFIFIWLNMYRAARGVIFATLLLAFLMLIIKYM
jgi:hypothetical protein